MKKLLAAIIILSAVFLLNPKSALAQSSPYVVTNFDSNITIEQDSSLIVSEIIKVNFDTPKHGIYRNIPVVYRSSEKVINSRLSVLSVKDEKGKGYKYTTTRDGDNIQIKIGDANKTIIGVHTYQIIYRVRNIIQRFEDHDELYWNVAGDGWDTDILNASAVVISKFAGVTSVQCYSGQVNTRESKCDFPTPSNDKVMFVSNTVLGEGKDMTIVVALNKNNQLVFTRSTRDLISDYWAYPFAILPILAMFILWYKNGRDQRYMGDNIYYKEANSATESTPLLFKREYLPMVYSPINGLTPSELGTIIDESVDTHDVVAEIVELGRLRYLKIEKVVKKLAPDDYKLTKLKEADGKLREYQQYLLDSLFSLGKKDNEVLLSELKSKFYTKLAKFKEKLYKYVFDQDYFFARPDTTRGIWLVAAGVAIAVVFSITMYFAQNTGDYTPLFLLIASAVPVLVIAYHMPRKTASGYSLYRQAKGLQFYLGKGKWREEVNEKHLFLEEMLPLAISLGVVKQLARDMDKLGVKPPSYFNAPAAVWASSFNSFSTAASSAVITGAKSSGGWSGGSGFSGGGGGGFGGGGGGSW